MIQAYQASTDGLEGSVHPEHQDRKGLQVLEVLDKRVTLVCVEYLEFPVCREVKEAAENLVYRYVCLITLLAYCSFFYHFQFHFTTLCYVAYGICYEILSPLCLSVLSY